MVQAQLRRSRAGSQPQAEGDLNHRWGSRAGQNALFPLLRCSPLPGSACCNKAQGAGRPEPQALQASAHEISDDGPAQRARFDKDLSLYAGNLEEDGPKR